jgi:hypothetical protein
MRSVGIEVARVVGENAFEVALAEDEDVIEALASHAAEEAHLAPDVTRDAVALLDAPASPAKRDRPD